MVTQYDEKGKIFTQIVSKEPIRVTIQTAQGLIRGSIHVRPNERTKDELNGEDRFLAVTDAVIYNNEDREISRARFLVVNINQIIWVIPEEEVSR